MTALKGHKPHEQIFRSDVIKQSTHDELPLLTPIDLCVDHHHPSQICLPSPPSLPPLSLLVSQEVSTTDV